jgi:hypothetical protein
MQVDRLVSEDKMVTVLEEYILCIRWALTALAPRPTVVYCASPFFSYPFSNPALRT